MKILSPYISCLIQSGFDGKDETDELKAAIDSGFQQIFIQTPKGVLKHHVLRPGKDGAERFVRIPVNEVPGVKMKDISPDVQFLPAGKIPMVLLTTVKAFFRAVIDAKGTAVEAMIWILWNQERGYYLHVPNQVVGHASAKYDWAGLPPDSSIIVDIHSHADFNAFFSGTDNSDDMNSIRYSGVIGFNNRPNPVTVWRFNYFGMKIDLKLEDIFEEEIVEADVPKGWLDAVTSTPPVGRPRMDGTVYRGTVPYQGGHVGRFPDPTEERTGTPAGESWKENKRGTGGTGKKKHFGGQKTTWDPSEGEEGDPVGEYWSKGVTPRNSVYVNGRYFVDTGNGLIEVPKEDLAQIPESHPLNKGLSKEAEMAEAVELAEAEMRVKAFLGENISDTAESNFHEFARRQAQEDILSDSADRHFAGDGTVSQPEEEDIHVGSVNGLQMDPQDIPAEYHSILGVHGEHVANAYAIIDHMSTDLVSSPEILGRTVENLFNLLDDDYRLPIFRTLAGLLSTAAHENLGLNGL